MISGTVSARYDTINAESIIQHLQILRDAHGEKGTIYFILDQAPYHRAEVVAREAEKLNVILKFLPTYSPNLNPIERLWKVMNENVRNNRFFKSAKDFKQSINDFFKNIFPKIGSSLGQRINDNFQSL